MLTFEHDETNDSVSEAFEDTKEASRTSASRKLGYDKVIMQAGGIGYGKADQALKDTPKTR